MVTLPRPVSMSKAPANEHLSLALMPQLGRIFFQDPIAVCRSGYYVQEECTMPIS